MSKRRPTAIVKWSRGQLSPVSAYDAQLLADEADGREFDLVRRSKRSLPHNSKYWAQLGQIVKATDAFSSADHFHTWIKVRLGYVEPILGPKGQIVGMTVQSAAFDRMDQAAFHVFYEKAVRLVAEEMAINMDEVGPGWPI